MKRMGWIVAAAIVLLGLTSGSAWIRVKEVRLIPQETTGSGNSSCDEEGSLIYVSSARTICLCMPEIGGTNLRWYRMSNESAIPLEDVCPQAYILN